MFQSISWQEFLTAISLIVGGYYAITTLLLYGAEITSIFKQEKSKSIELKVSEDQNDSSESNDLMGKVKYETQVNVPHENEIESSELNVAQAKEADEPIKAIDPREEMLAGFARRRLQPLSLSSLQALKVRSFLFSSRCYRSILNWSGHLTKIQSVF